MAHFCSMGPGSASCAEDILTAIFPEVVPSSTGSASYLWSTCVSMGAGARLHLAPSFWALHLSSFGLCCHYFYLFLDSAVKELILLTLPLLWVGSEVFKSAPTISLGVDVSLVAPCCTTVLPTGGMGL